MIEIKVTMTVEVPETASVKDLTDYLDVEYAQTNTMKKDNPCIDNSEVTEIEWEFK